jgi:acetyl-CoA decarbonylase/synthase complex subunit epsilon
MTETEPWQKAEISGPKKAFVVSKPKVVSGFIKRSKRPLMVIGHESVKEEVGGEKLLDYMIRLAEKGGMPIVATANMIGSLKERGYPKAFSFSLIEIGERLRDQSWIGLEGKGQYDLVLMMGFPYYMSWLVFSGLKHYALRGDDKYLTTISLDRYYHPHATWSLPNISLDKWSETISNIIKELEVE